MSRPSTPVSVVVTEMPTAAASAPTQEAAAQTDAPKRYEFRQVESQFQDAYVFEEQNHSAILDLIAVYLKGQKILYTEAKTLCEQRLNYLMLPAIFITALCSILVLILKEQAVGPTLVSSLNGLNAFLLSLITYLKLDARAEAHRTSAYKFDKLQSQTVFSSGKVLFVNDESTNIVELIEQIEKEVQEIKESNQFVLPEKIRYHYPLLYSTNVFARVKEFMYEETREINALKDLLNDRARAAQGLEDSDTAAARAAAQAECDRLEQAYRAQVLVCLKMKEKYRDVDALIEKDLEEQRVKAIKRWELCGWLKN
jgi:hypothetical protein